MKSEVDILLKMIEDRRRELHTLTRNRRFTDPMVVALSEELDDLLNEYNAMTNVLCLASK